MLPHTTKRRKTTNLKSINHQKCQKIKLHGTPTTTELKKQSKRTSRLVRQRMKRNCSEATDHGDGAGCSASAGCEGGADLRGNGNSEVAVDYGSCRGGRNFQPYTRVG